MCGPPLSFGGPITPATLGASVASADVHLSDELPLLQAAEASRIATTNRAALELGIPFVSFDTTPIFFVEIGRMDTMLEIVDAMIDDGFYLNGAMWPIVPHRRAGLRFTVTNSIDESAIVDLLELLRGHLQAHDLLERLEIDLRNEDPVIRLGGNGG
jgi:7-keto-8-aminopelargonate synthetase-like enzyme